MPFRGLDYDQSLALAWEVDEAASLARSGLRTLANLHTVYEDGATVLTLMAIASEKLLKLSLGVLELDERGSWPSKSQMRAHGHDVLKLRTIVEGRYRPRIDRSTVAPLVRTLLDDCEQDQDLGTLLEALSRWGRQGRFDRLDTLAGSPQTGPRAEDLWQETESSILERETEILLQIADPAGYSVGRPRLNDLMSNALHRWWEMHARMWTTGVLGNDVKGLGSALQIDPSRK